MALLAQNNITLSSSQLTSSDIVLPNGQMAIFDGIQFQMIVASAGANASTFNFILSELYYPTNTTYNKWSVNNPLAANSTVYNGICMYFPFGQNGLVMGTTSQVTLAGNIGASSTAAYHFAYYLFGDYL